MAANFAKLAGAVATRVVGANREPFAKRAKEVRRWVPLRTAN